MPSTLEEINSKIAEALEKDQNFMLVQGLRLSHIQYAHIMNCLSRNGLRPHQIRNYIIRLIDEDYSRWCKQNSRVLKFDNITHKVTEEAIKQNVN